MGAFRRLLAAIGLVELWIALIAFVFVIALTMVQVALPLLAGSVA